MTLDEIITAVSAREKSTRQSELTTAFIEVRDRLVALEQSIKELHDKKISG